MPETVHPDTEGRLEFCELLMGLLKSGCSVRMAQSEDVFFVGLDREPVTWLACGPGLLPTLKKAVGKLPPDNGLPSIG